MTAGELLSEVWARYLRTEAQPFIAQNDPGIWAYLDRWVAQASRLACERWEQSVSVSTVIDDPTYDLLSASPRIHRAMTVWINGYQMVGLNGAPGEITIDDLNRYLYGWRETPASTPRAWYRWPYMDQELLGIYPKPDAVYELLVGGFALQDQITSSTSVVRWPARSHEALVKYIAYQVMDGRASGASGEKRNALLQQSVAILTEEGRLNQQAVMLTNVEIRGKHLDGGYDLSGGR